MANETARYVQGEGNKRIIDYVTTAAVVVDEVLVCGTNGNVSVGVAQVAAAASGETISVDIGGVYDFTKVTGAVIKAGETVDWDASTGSVEDNQSTLATGDVGDFGVALEDAGSGVLVIKVELRGGTTAIT